MTGLTARNFGLQDRGVLRPGCFADVTVFDPETVDDSSPYGAPVGPASGIKHVLVNGSVAWNEGLGTGSRTGVAVRRICDAASN